MSIIEERTKAYSVKVGELPEREQRDLTYQALKELQETFVRGATTSEVQGYLNETLGPRVKFSETQVWRNLYKLENEDKKVKSKEKVVNDRQLLLFSTADKS